MPLFFRHRLAGGLGASRDHLTALSAGSGAYLGVNFITVLSVIQ